MLALAALAAAAAPYTFLVCEEAHSCNDYCTMRTGWANQQWHVASCPHPSEVCNGANIQCSSLRYVTIEDVKAQYGARAAATNDETHGKTALFVSVVASDAELATGADEASQRQVEWLHVMAQGVSNVGHWLGPPDGWMGLRSLEQMLGGTAGEAGKMHLTMDDAALLQSSLLPAAGSNGVHVNSFSKRYESSVMPDGSNDIGGLVVQISDASLHSAIVTNSRPHCAALQKLALGIADNYDFVFFVAHTSGYYTSVHMAAHQEAIPGTGTGRTWIGGCGGERVKGAVLLQPLSQGQTGPFFHEWCAPSPLLTLLRPSSPPLVSPPTTLLPPRLSSALPTPLYQVPPVRRAYGGALPSALGPLGLDGLPRPPRRPRWFQLLLLRRRRHALQHGRFQRPGARVRPRPHAGLAHHNQRGRIRGGARGAHRPRRRRPSAAGWLRRRTLGEARRPGRSARLPLGERYAVQPARAGVWDG